MSYGNIYGPNLTSLILP